MGVRMLFLLPLAIIGILTGLAYFYTNKEVTSQSDIKISIHDLKIEIELIKAKLHELPTFIEDKCIQSKVIIDEEAGIVESRFRTIDTNMRILEQRQRNIERSLYEKAVKPKEAPSQVPNQDLVD